MLDKKSKIKNNTIEEKLIEIGLDLEKIPEILQENEKLDFRITKTYDDKHYKEYNQMPNAENIIPPKKGEIRNPNELYLPK